MKHLLLLIGFIGYQSKIQSAITCRDPTGKAVDWFIVYKVPKTTADKTSNGHFSGTEFYYMDNSSIFFEYRQSNISSETNNPLYNTLQPLYSKNTDIKSYAMYNDQPPMGNTRSDKAHSKGAVAFDKDNGFWMVSSVPHFPAKVSSGFIYRSSQTKNGQTILCVTVPAKMKNKINQIFQLTRPYIYDTVNFNVAESNESNAMYMNFATSGNNKLILFAKPIQCNEDIYSKFIAPMFQQKLFVQTWREKLDDDKWVEDIKYVRFYNGPAFETNIDHSKWAVADKDPWTCIGDLNRDEPQFRRGGLSLCLYDQHVATAFRLLFLRDYAMTFAKQLYKECVEKALRQLTIQLEKRRPKSIAFRLKNSVFKRIIECSPEPIRPIHKHKTCNNENIKEPKPCLIKELT